MKKCPFCAEEIQDAAIKCRHCGSQLNVPPKAAVNSPASPEPSAAPARRFHNVTESDTVLLPERAVIELPADSRITKRVEELLAEKHVTVLRSTPRPSDASRPARSFQGTTTAPTRQGSSRAWIILFLVVIGLAVPIWWWSSGPTSLPSIASLDKERQRGIDSLLAQKPTGNALAGDEAYLNSATRATAPSARAAQNTAGSESNRSAVDEMVKQGLIKRMDLTTGKIYIWGELWDGFELDAKQNLVKVISRQRQAEQGLPQVTLYESRSGKELASYGPFAGVTIQ